MRSPRIPSVGIFVIIPTPDTHLIHKYPNMIEVKQSPLHGRGLFAATPIPADTVLGDLVTVPVDDHELGGPYVLWLDNDKPVRVTCDLRFINHSDTPNAVYYDDMTVVALRNIDSGEEILHDYLGDAIDDNIKEAPEAHAF